MAAIANTYALIVFFYLLILNIAFALPNVINRREAIDAAKFNRCSYLTIFMYYKSRIKIDKYV